MGWPVRVARVPGGQAPDIQSLKHADAATFKLGALVVSAAGEINECGADPAAILGVALQAVKTSPGWDAANSPTVVTGRQQKVSVAVANRQTVFSAPLTNNSAVNIVPTQADVHVEYGLTAYSGEWTVDKNKTGASARVEIVGFDTNVNGGKGVVFFKVLEANLQSP